MVGNGISDPSPVSSHTLFQLEASIAEERGAVQVGKTLGVFSEGFPATVGKMLVKTYSILFFFETMNSKETLKQFFVSNLNIFQHQRAQLMEFFFRVIFARPTKRS